MIKGINHQRKNEETIFHFPPGIIPEGKEEEYLVLEKEHPNDYHRLIHRRQLHSSVLEDQADLHPHSPDFHFHQSIISWIAPEYHQYHKSKNWWLTAGFILILILIAEGLTGNWTMLLATVVFAAVYWQTHHFHPPRHLKIKISDVGVRIGNRNIPYQDIAFFGIVYDPPMVKRLHLRLNKGVFNDLTVELAGQNPQELKRFLRQYLPEHESIKEHLTDIILRIFQL